MEKAIRNSNSMKKLDSRLRGNDKKMSGIGKEAGGNDKVGGTGILPAVLFVVMSLLCGCDGFRFAPKEEQKQNAYLHWRTAGLAAQIAAGENTSQQLQGLTELSAQQSRAFTADYGMPSQLPAADSPEQILNGAGAAVAEKAYQQSLQRPDVWQTADGMFEMCIGLAGILGGVYGIRSAQFLKQARDKSRALKEIIEGNELFKKTNPLQMDAFKEAQKNQSLETKKIVTETKASS